MLTKEQEKLAREEVFKITGIKNFKSITQNILLDEMTNMLVCFNYTASLKQLHSGNFTELATTNTSSFENAKRINRLLHHKGDGIYILIVNTQDGVLSYTTSLRNMLDFYLDGAISKDNRFYFRANVEDAVNKKETLSLHTCSHKNKCIYILTSLQKFQQWKKISITPLPLFSTKSEKTKKKQELLSFRLTN